jgi:hypothetical protein
MAPVFHGVAEDGDMLFVGGNLWDGRATEPFRYEVDGQRPRRLPRDAT